MDSAPAKREFAIALLQESSVFIHLDPRREGTKVPGWLKRQPQLVLQVGLNMAVRIPDLDIGEQAICCTLSFNRSPFFCYIPWTAVFGLVGEDGRGRIWPEDVPLEIASQMQQQASKDAAKSNAKAQRQQARARLQAVRSPDETQDPKQPEPAAKVSAAQAAAEQLALPLDENVKPLEKVPGHAPQPETAGGTKPSSPPGKKRELPAYLRVVK
jgi:stringent starvation protein B